MSDLSERLRDTATHLTAVYSQAVTPSEAAHLMRMAADRLDKLDPPQERVTGDIPGALRQGASYHVDDVGFGWLRDAMRAAADLIETHQLQREAVSPEPDLMSALAESLREKTAAAPEIGLGPDPATFSTDAEWPTPREIGEHVDALVTYIDGLERRLRALENHNGS